jgi:hypothetical protein
MRDDSPGAAAAASADARRDRSLRAVLLGAIALLAVAAAGFVVASRGPGLSWVNTDAASILRIGTQMAHGQILYVDQFDANPPTVFLAAEAAARVAAATGVSVILLWHLTIVALGAAGTWFLVRALARGPGVAGVVAVCGAYAAVVLAGGTAHFGQRPHVFLVVFVPYFFQRMTGDSRTRGFTAWCLVTAFFATMKPYYAAQVLVVEASVFVARRTLDPRIRGTLLAGALAPVALLWITAPASLDAFVHRVVPFVFGGPYDAYRGSTSEFLRSSRHLRLVVLAAAFAIAATAARRLRAADTRAVVTAAATVGIAYASIFHQHKFWAYHCLTTLFLCTTYTAWFGAAALDAVSARVAGALRTALAASGAAAAIGCAALLWSTAAERQPSADGLAALCAGERRVYVVTPTAPLYLDTVALEAGFELVGGTTALMIVPAASEPDAAESARKLRELVLELGAVIDRERPKLVAVSTSTQAMSGTDAHAFLVGRGGLFPRPGYRRVPDAEVAAACAPLARDVIYRRD